MSKRITLVTIFDKVTISNINNLVNIVGEKICKVPYGIDDDNRKKIDTLPFHFTISAWDKEYEEKVVGFLDNINFKKIKVKVNKVEIMKGKNNSFVLFLSIKENQDIKNIQQVIYNKLPSEKYNPGKFTFHITLHIDKDYNTIIQMKQKLEDKFESFEIEINKLGLFEIYPANLIKEIQ